MLYTIIDPCEVFSNSMEQKYFYKKVEKIVLQGVQYNGQIIVNRLYSTNPQDYLNPRYTPGERW